MYIWCSTLPLRSKEEEEEEEVQVEKQPRYEKAIQASAATSESESEEFYDTITYQSDPEVLQAVHNIEAMMQRLNDSVNKLHERHAIYQSVYLIAFQS